MELHVYPTALKENTVMAPCEFIEILCEPNALDLVQISVHNVCLLIIFKILPA